MLKQTLNQVKFVPTYCSTRANIVGRRVKTTATFDTTNVGRMLKPVHVWCKRPEFRARTYIDLAYNN